MNRLIDHFYILSTIIFTVYSQLIMRWQVELAGPLPASTAGKFGYVISLLMNPWVITGIAATFLAGISWMLAMTKFEISYAYPFISLNYVVIFFASFLIFNESFNMYKLMGTALIIAGVAVLAKGS